jgi:tetratricopeptide (TPR) repeat protein
MGRLLIVGNPSQERDSLAIILEFAGHECEMASTLEEVGAFIRNGNFQLVLADSPLGDRGLEETVLALRRVAPRAPVMFLTEEVDPRLKSDEVVSATQPIGDNVATPISLVSLGEALAVLLPKPEAFRQLAQLPQTPAMLNRIAGLYQAQKEYKSAEQLYQKALQVAEDTKKGPGEIATLLNNLASMYHEQRKLAQAEPLYRQSLEIVEKTFGPNHVKVARRLRHLADLYQATGKRDMAAPLLERLKGMS